MIALRTTSEEEAQLEAVSISRKHPGRYVLVFNCFGAFAEVHERLHVNAPGDTPFDWYVLNGRVKRFTDAQRGADQRATPALA